MSAAAPSLSVPDLTTCDREPIHVPGSIQPHGALFVLREPELSIVQISANAAAFTGVASSELLGCPLGVVFEPPSVDRVGDALAGARPQDDALLLAAGGRTFDGIVHRHGGATILEIEPHAAGVEGGAAVPHAQIRSALDRMSAAGDVRELCDAAVCDVRLVTGYDRVLLYRFGADGHGEVVAEQRRPDLEPFLGLRYPASDIPRQAREIYLRCGLRMIPDRDYVPVPIVPAERPETGEPLDLTYSVLRSVSPVHLEYMRNIGFRASMSVSLVRAGALWGLISCSHGAPHHVPPAVRAVCEILARFLSAQLEAKERRAELDGIARRSAAIPRIRDSMRLEATVLDGLMRGSPNLLDVVEADGAAVCCEGACATLGRTPGAAQIRLLCEWLRSTPRGEVFATSELPRVYAAGEPLRGVASGVLAFSLPKPDPECVLWFRPEVAQTVRWGGDPSKPVDEAQGVLRPRRSFAIWKEIVRGTSLPWSAADVEAAASLRRAATEIDLARQVEREQAARAAAEAAQLRLFFLRDAGALLARSLDYEATLGTVASLVTDRFADICVIDVIDETGVLRRVQARHADPAKQGMAEELRGYTPSRSDERNPPVIVGGRPCLCSRVDPDWLRSHRTRDEAHLELLWSRLQVRSLIAVPLVARGRILGEIFCMTAESGRIYGEPELAVAEELARSAAVAIENAGLYRRAQEALDDARRATQARDEMLAIVSHDLANPIGAVLASATSLLPGAGAPEGREARVEKATARILRSVTRMQALLGDLRDVERIRTQRFVIEPRPEEVGALVDEALELQRPLAEQKHIALRLDVPAPETLVRADRDRVFQVLGNLLGNAVKFTPTGGSIDVAARPRQADVCFAIHDSGPGIPEEHRGDVFARGWSASPAAGGGTGLGLYIAKGIVEAHGGRIWAEGRPGEGTTMSFTLPIA